MFWCSAEAGSKQGMRARSKIPGVPKLLLPAWEKAATAQRKGVALINPATKKASASFSRPTQENVSCANTGFPSKLETTAASSLQAIRGQTTFHGWSV